MSEGLVVVELECATLRNVVSFVYKLYFEYDDVSVVFITVPWYCFSYLSLSMLAPSEKVAVLDGLQGDVGLGALHASCVPSHHHWRRIG